MNELRELNVAEMAMVEGGGDPVSDFLASVLAGLESLFSNVVIGPIVDAVKSFFEQLQYAILSFLEGLGGGST